jgi:hypothetical protein
MRQWLLDDPSEVVEPKFTLQAEKDLWATKTGQVATSYPDEVSVGDLNLQEAQRLAAERRAFWQANDKQTCLAEVRRLIRLPESRGRPEVASRDAIGCDGYSIERLLIRREGAIPVPALLFLPDAPAAKRPATICVDARGKRASGQRCEALALQGRVVLSIDARGWGETCGEEYRVGMLALHVGQPLLGGRVADVLTALDVLLQRSDVDASQIELIGAGTAGPVALHAAALDERIASLALENSIHSWVDDVVAQPRRAGVIAHMVPSALLKYDLPDLLAATAPRPVRVEDKRN